MTLAIADEDVLAMLEERPYPTPELAQLFGVSGYRIRALCSRLASTGRVQRVGRGKNARAWMLAPERVEAPEPPKPRLMVDAVEFESVWHGHDSLDVLRPSLDRSCTSGMGQSLSGAHHVASTGRRV